MIWLIMGALVLAALLFVCAPLYRKTPPQTLEDSEIADYQAEIAALENAAGADQNTEESGAAKLALQRSLIVHKARAVKADAGPPAVLLASLFIVFSFGVMGLYSILGRPELTGKTAAPMAGSPVLSAQQAIAQSDRPEHENQMSLSDLVVQLEQKLQQDGSNPEGWMLYARSLMTLRRFDEALAAYDRVLMLTDNNPSVLEERDSARAYAAQQGGAAAQTSRPGPTAEQMQAAGAMSESDRAAMIEGMVEGLSAKLEANPDDPDGWVRLLRARKVLGQDEKARAEIQRMKSQFAGQPETITQILSSSGWKP